MWLCNGRPRLRKKRAVWARTRTRAHTHTHTQISNNECDVNYGETNENTGPQAQRRVVHQKSLMNLQIIEYG